MTYTEIKIKNNRKYYYRVLSIRKQNKVTKKRKYLGVNLSKKELEEKERKADKNLVIKNKKRNKELKKKSNLK